MATKAEIEDFLSQRKLAVVGVSRGGKKYGNAAFRELKAKGYQVYPVNPRADVIEGERCYPGLVDLPETVGGVVVVVPPAEAEKVVRDAAKAGIRRVWLQPGAESEDAVRFCEENGLTVIHRECILMFATPTAFYHPAHRGLNSLMGKLPK